MPRSDSFDECKGGESKGGESKGGDGGDFEENELLMMVAVAAGKHLFGPDSELNAFKGAHVADFVEALEGDRTGAGSPLKAMDRYRSIHREYSEIMEETLEAIVKKEGGTIDAFMRDARRALNGGEGFLFEDDNYSAFVAEVQAMDDYGCFHRMMVDAAAAHAAFASCRSHK